MKDFYYILGVSANAPAPEIREAYRKLSKKFHPDLNQNDSYFESRFKEIQEAYETLSDPLRRKRYDATFKNTSPPPPRHNSTAPPKQKYYPRTTAVDVVFTIVLISITVLFGNYVWNAINGSKLLKTINPVAATIAPIKAIAPAHHKHKKHLIDSSGIILIPKTASQSKPVAVKPPTPTVIILNSPPKNVTAKSNVEKSNNDTFKSRTAQVSNYPFSDLPYSSYLRSNITGVINMHKADSFNSGIVAVIPANSKVTVLAKGLNYYKVRFNDDIGYVPSWTVKSR